MNYLSDPLVGLVALIIVGAILRMNRKRLQNLLQSNNTAERSNNMDLKNMNWKRGITDLWERMFPTQPQEPLFDYFMRLATATEAPAQASTQGNFTQAPVARTAVQPVTAYQGNTSWLTNAQPQVQSVKLSTVAAADNILVVGQKGAGKTTLLQKVIDARASELLGALDPHAKPGKWPCEVIGAGRDYTAIGTALLGIERDMDTRFKQLARGEVMEGHFARRSVVTDEYRSIADKLNGKGGVVDAGSLLLNRISEGRKVNECVLVACHNDTGEALGITGNTDMKTCFDYIVYMGGLVDSNRTQRCPVEIKAEALKRDRPAVAWLTEKNQWFVLDDDLPMPMVSSVSAAGTPVLVRDESVQSAGTEPSYQYRTSTVPATDAEAQLDHDINLLHSAGISWNKIGEMLQLKGQKQARNARIRQALGLDVAEIVDAA